jgi:general secretion pathway protein D
MRRAKQGNGRERVTTSASKTHRLTAKAGRWRAAFAVLGLALLGVPAGCNTTYLEETRQTMDASRQNDPLARATQADLAAKKPAGGGFLGLFGGASRDREAQVFPGQDTARFSPVERTSLSRLSGQTFELSLDNADVPTAARAVLGNILGIGYTIDARSQGSISLNSGGAIPADQLLDMFEQALRSNNIAMLREGQRLRLIPAEEAVGAAQLDADETVSPGYGVTVMKLRFVSASTVLPLLESFVSRQGMVREDPGGNALIFQGTAEERRAGIEAARSFDQDWLANESVGIFPVTNASASSLIPELNRVLDLEQGGRGSNTMRVQAVERSNSILVVAKSQTLLRRAAQWVNRLDKVDPASANLRVYRVQHVDPERLASMVNSIFNSGGASPVNEDPAAQLPPGSEPTRDTSGQPGNASPDLTNAMADRFGSDQIGGQTQDPATPAPAPAASSSGGSSGIRITASKENNSILIFARPDQQRSIEQAILALDRPSDQVAIEATIAEVVLTNDLKYGVQYFLKSKDLGLGDDNGSVGLFREATKAAIGQVVPGFNLVVGSQSDPSVVIDALRGITEVKILSSPSVVVMDNKPAKLQVGDEVPIVTRTSQSVTDPDAPIVNNVEYKNTGVILNVLPRITANGTINLQIQQEISSVSSSGSSLTPTVSQRRVSSTVSVVSGQTVMLGGLISERQEKGRSGVPLLGDLPVIGEAFRTNNNKATRTELIILIKPQVIRDGADAQAIAEAMRAQLSVMNGPSKRIPLPRPQPTIIE